jgi:hypothetical protein
MKLYGTKQTDPNNIFVIAMVAARPPYVVIIQGDGSETWSSAVDIDVARKTRKKVILLN